MVNYRCVYQQDVEYQIHTEVYITGTDFTTEQEITSDLQENGDSLKICWIISSKSKCLGTF